MGPQTASATQVDNQTLANPISLQNLQNARSGVERPLTKTYIVNERKVFLIVLVHNSSITFEPSFSINPARPNAESTTLKRLSGQSRLNSYPRVMRNWTCVSSPR